MVARHYLAVAAVFAAEYCDLAPDQSERIRQALEAALEGAVADLRGPDPSSP